MASAASTRFRVAAMVTIPLVALAAMWVFAAVPGFHAWMALRDAETVRKLVVEPGERLAVELRREHVLSAEYLAVRSRRGRAVLAGQRERTDRVRDELRAAVSSDEARAAFDPETAAEVEDLMRKVERTDALRASIDRGEQTPVTLSAEFALVPEAVRAVASGVVPAADPALHRDAHGVIAMARAADRLDGQRALAAGVLAEGRAMKAAELREFTALSVTRKALFEQGLAELTAELRAPFLALIESAEYAKFARLEERLLAGGRSTRGDGVSHARWRTAADRATSAFAEAIQKTVDTINERAATAAADARTHAWGVGLLGLAVMVGAAIPTGLVGRRLTGELTRLRAVGATLDNAKESARAALVGQARLRETAERAIGDLARRNQSLLQRQLRMLHAVRRDTSDVEAVPRLLALDHLTIRMRRHAERLIILSGGSSGRSWRRPVPVDDALRAAVAGVEDHRRVRVYPMADVLVIGTAVADVAHVLAELIENATTFSPPNTEVSIRGACTGSGFVIEIEDRGEGLPQERLAQINQRLARPARFDLSDTRHLGLAVVGKLAVKHGLRVELSRSPFGGTMAVVHLPRKIVIFPEVGEEDDQTEELVGVAGSLPEEPEESGGPKAAAQ